MPCRAAIPVLLATACGPGTNPPRECEPTPLEHDGAIPPAYEPPSIPNVDCDHASALVPGPLQPLPMWPAPGDGNYQGSRIALELSLERTDAGPWQQSATFSTYIPEVWEDIRFDGWRCGVEIDPLDDVDDCRVRVYYGIETRYGIAPFGGPDLRPIEVHTPHWTESIPRLSSTYHHGVLSPSPAWGEPYGISWASDGAGFPADSISLVAHLGCELAIDEPTPGDAIGPSAMQVRWSGCGESPLLLVLRAAAIDLDRGDVVDVLCRVDDDGELTIPGDAMHLVDPSWIAEISLMRTVQRTHAIALPKASAVSQRRSRSACSPPATLIVRGRWALPNPPVARRYPERTAGMEPTDMTQEILRKIQTDLSEMRSDTRARFDQIDGRLDGVDRRLDRVGRRLDEHGRRLDSIDHRLDGIDHRLEGIDHRLEEATGRIRAVERRMGDLVEITGHSVTRQIDVGRRVDSPEDRVDVLERR